MRGRRRCSSASGRSRARSVSPRPDPAPRSVLCKPPLLLTPRVLLGHGPARTRWRSWGWQEAAIQRARAVAHGRSPGYAGSHFGDDQATAGMPSASSRPVPVFGCVWRAQRGPRMHAGARPHQRAALAAARRSRRARCSSLPRGWPSGVPDGAASPSVTAEARERAEGALYKLRHVLPMYSVRPAFLRRALSRGFT